MSSFGDTVDDAIRMTLEATELYLDMIDDLGERERVFAERGLTFYSDEPSADTKVYTAVHPGEVVSSQRLALPVIPDPWLRRSCPAGKLRRPAAGWFREDAAGEGSHQSFTNEAGWVVIVKLGAKAIPPGTMRSILQQAGMTAEEFVRHVRAR